MSKYLKETPISEVDLSKLKDQPYHMKYIDTERPDAFIYLNHLKALERTGDLLKAFSYIFLEAEQEPIGYVSPSGEYYPMDVAWKWDISKMDAVYSQPCVVKDGFEKWLKRKRDKAKEVYNNCCDDNARQGMYSTFVAYDKALLEYLEFSPIVGEKQVSDEQIEKAIEIALDNEGIDGREITTKPMRAIRNAVRTLILGQGKETSK